MSKTLWQHAAILALIGIPASACAQDAFPVMDWGPIIQTEATNSVVEDIGRSEAKRAGIPYPGDRKRARPMAPVASTLAQGLARQVARGGAPDATVAAGYAPTSAVRQKLAALMAKAAARQGPSQAEEMRHVVASGRALAEYRRVAPAIGLRSNDAIDAYAFYLLAQWGVANDHRADVTRAQVAGVRRQAANAYATIANRLTTDALRQEFAEMLIVQGAIMAGVHEAAVRGGDNSATARYAALARRGGVAIFSVDPTRIALTDAGFRLK